MKTRKNLALALVSGALILLLSGDVLARSGRRAHVQRVQRGVHEMVEPGQMRLERMTQRLDLTEEQQAAIGELLADVRKNNLELRKQLERVRHELAGEMLKDQPDERTVVQLTERIGKLRSDMQVNKAKNRLAIRTHLTAEQRDLMILRDRRGSRFGSRSADGQRGRRQMFDECPMHHTERHPHHGFKRGAERF